MYPNLEAELKRRNIKRADLAEPFGCAITTISEKMQGNSDFSVKAAKKIKEHSPKTKILFLIYNYPNNYIYFTKNE